MLSHLDVPISSPAGEVLIPYDLRAREKRLYIRFLMADDLDVQVMGNDGKLREPRKEEISTPERKADGKRKRGRSDSDAESSSSSQDARRKQSTKKGKKDDKRDRSDSDAESSSSSDESRWKQSTKTGTKVVK